MNAMQKGLAIIRKAEVALREAASDAAAAGDYEATMKLAAWGQELGRLASSQTPSVELQSSPAPLPSRTAEKTRTVASPFAFERSGDAGAPQRRPENRKGADDYPWFLRKGEHLVKTGWSKRDKSEYQHKASRQVLDALVGALGAACAKGEPVAIPDLLPLKAGDEESELPPYQVYVCLAWLRKIGLVQQHGREGYTVTRPDALTADVSAAWDALERRRSA